MRCYPLALEKSHYLLRSIGSFCEHVQALTLYYYLSAGCTKCTGFKSSFTCGCGSSVGDHTTVVETAEEREARGHPLGEATPYAAMGGITGFSSMAEGYMRLDPSGRGN